MDDHYHAVLVPVGDARIEVAIEGLGDPVPPLHLPSAAEFRAARQQPGHHWQAPQNARLVSALLAASQSAFRASRSGRSTGRA